jgi:hypothetical protein
VPFCMRCNTRLAFPNYSRQETGDRTEESSDAESARNT